MKNRLGVIGAGLILAGVGFVVAGGVAYAKVQDGYDSLQAFSEAGERHLTYNDQGQLTDRGETTEADAIMALLADDWQYPVVNSDLDPDDPLVNTASEYMYQMATVAYHTLHGTQTVTLDEAVEYNGETFAAGTTSSTSTAATGPTSTAPSRSRDRLVSRPGPAQRTVWSPSSASAPSPTALSKWAWRWPACSPGSGWCSCSPVAA